MIKNSMNDNDRYISIKNDSNSHYSNVNDENIIK